MAELDADARRGLIARVRAAATALAVARTPEVVPWRFGRAVLDPVYRHSYDNNCLLVEEPLDGADLDDLVGAADALMEPRGLTHRRIDNLDPADDARLRPGFEAAGWRREDSTWMASVRPPDRPATDNLAREVPWGELRATVVTSTSREPYATDPEVVRQLVDRMERLRAAATVRHFAVPAPTGGSFAAYCHLFLGAAPGCAQVEEVMTLEEWRTRGFARAVVLAAVDAARADGADCTWLYADEEDWPKELYRKLGFVLRSVGGAVAGWAGPISLVALVALPWALTPAGAGLLVGSGTLGLAYLLVASDRAGGKPTDIGTVILAGVPVALFAIGLAGTFVAHRRVRAA